MGHGVSCAAPLALSGCSYLDVPEGAPRDDGGNVTASAAAGVTTLEVGDCPDEPDNEEFETVAAIPCTDAHQLEVYHDFEVDAPTLPADQAAWDALSEPCFQEAYTQYVGLAYDESELEAYTFTPTDEAWSYGDRTVQCLLGLPGLTPATGSLRGAAR
jgi:hypothetical protein